MADSIILNRIPVWIREYGSSGNSDSRAVQDFMICETAEAVRSLQAELMAITNGRVNEEVLDRLVGPKRRILYQTYQEWAKLMLQWIAAHKG